jgi:hypothetical protein
MRHFCSSEGGRSVCFFSEGGHNFGMPQVKTDLCGWGSRRSTQRLPSSGNMYCLTGHLPVLGLFRSSYSLIAMQLRMVYREPSAGRCSPSNATWVLLEPGTGLYFYCAPLRSALPANGLKPGFQRAGEGKRQKGQWGFAATSNVRAGKSTVPAATFRLPSNLAR